MVLVVVWHGARSAAQRRLLVWLMLLASMPAVLWSLFQYMTSAVPVADRYLHGVVANGNWWAGFLLLLAPLAYAFTLHEAGLKRHVQGSSPYSSSFR